MGVEVGKFYRTPWEPAGVILVKLVERGSDYTFAFGEFVGDHPNGYKSGSPARYLTKELEGRECDEKGALILHTKDPQPQEKP